MSAATEEKAETPKEEASVADDTAGADADPSEKPSGEKVKGVVNWFNVAKGFGFVTRDDGVGDVFVHQSDIYAEGFRSLREQEPVEFELEPIGDGRFKAVNVSGPDGAFVQGAPPRSSYGRQRVNFPMGGRGGVHPMARGLPPGMPYGVMAGGRVMGGHPGMGGPGMGYMPTMVHPGMPHMGVPGYPGMPMAPGMGAGMMPPMGPGGYQQVGEGGMPVPLPNIMGTEFGVQTGKRVVVLNLPWSTTWQALKEFFSGSGNIVRADIALDESGRSRGYGTVKFNTEEEASRAIATLNGADFEGRIITVRMDKFQN